MRIDGNTEVIPHLGYPTHTFKSPLIYNPYFEANGINAVVVPFACRPETFTATLQTLFQQDNVRNAIITMPHKVGVVRLLDEATATLKVAGACNAVKRLPDGRLAGDQFDGAGFVRGVQRKGLELHGARVLVVGCGGVGSPIAASLAAAGAAAIALFDVNAASAEALAARLRTHYPRIEVTTGSNDAAGFDLVVNATPLGMNPGDPLPFDATRLASRTFVGEVVLMPTTPLLQAAQARGCRTQVGTDMLFEMIPAYLEFFGFPAATPETLRSLARLEG